MRKYKNCCLGRVDWESITDNPIAERVVPNLSVRGKNVTFLDRLADALQLDTIRADSIKDFKKAFTPTAVRKIHEAAYLAWSGEDDLYRCLGDEADTTSALYIGQYDTRRILLGVSRHALYSERILLIDPILYAGAIAEQYNPLEHPEMHLSATLEWSWLWLLLAPWIEADLVHFVRDPGDFNADIARETMRVSEARYRNSPQLKAALDEEFRRSEDIINKSRDRIMLSMPDSYFRRMVREYDPDLTSDEVEGMLGAFQAMRDENPYVPDPPTRAPHQALFTLSSGSNYETAKMTAAISGSHLITDIGSRWIEIKSDYDSIAVQDEGWTPLAKAFHDTDLKFLNDVPLDAVLRIRDQGALDGMRTFLRRVWVRVRGEDLFSPTTPADLAAELQHEIGEAEEEWKAIERDLGRFLGAELIAGAVGAGPAIATGAGAWLAGGLAAAAATNLIMSTIKRRGFNRRHPAAFLLNLRDGT